MIRYKSSRQMTIGEFRTPFKVKLDKANRWVRLGESLPWDALASIYYRSMSSDMGAPAIDARVVIGAMIIKHKLKLDDRETIRENMYMSQRDGYPQYFLGLEEYTYNDVFDRSLFITLRYRLGADKFDAMTRQIILTSEGKHEAARKDLDNKRNDVNTNKVDKDGNGSGTLTNQAADKASSDKLNSI